MKSIKGSKTEKNLLKSFAGESQARNRYTYFASAARKEGYEQIANFFMETAENEKEHAKVFFKVPGGRRSGDHRRLSRRQDRDHQGEPGGRGCRRKNGMDHHLRRLRQDRPGRGLSEDAAASFEQIAKVEKFHESRYRKLINNVANGEVFKKKAPVKWHCINCGYVHEGPEAPKQCPACKHPQAYYEVLAENY